MIRLSDTKYYVRDSVPTDIPLYSSMLQNDAWMRDSGFSLDAFLNDEQIIGFISKKHADDIKWLLFHDEKGFLGFIHFNVISEDIVIVLGGIVSKYLNSGLGIKLYVESINMYFKLGNSRMLRQNVYQENLRSCKMNLAIGAKLVGLKIMDGYKFDVYETDKASFYDSAIVKRFLNG